MIERDDWKHGLSVLRGYYAEGDRAGVRSVLVIMQKDMEGWALGSAGMALALLLDRYLMFDDGQIPDQAALITAVNEYLEEVAQFGVTVAKPILERQQAQLSEREAALKDIWSQLAKRYETFLKQEFSSPSVHRRTREMVRHRFFSELGTRRLWQSYGQSKGSDRPSEKTIRTRLGDIEAEFFDKQP